MKLFAPACMTLAALCCLSVFPAMLRAQSPAWAADAVWYQIFPERFRNGDPTNDPTKEDCGLAEDREWHISPWTSDWYKLQPWESAHTPDFYECVFERRYGGDLQGVIDELDYLAGLGITALYFNPLFESISLHKYDASSYHHIDHTFGPNPRQDARCMVDETDEPSTWHWTAADSLFLKLVLEAHRRNIKVVIDGVFNHSGTQFFAFRDVVENQRRSRYADWYDVRHWDDDRTPHSEFVYKGWWDHPSMPEFREDANGFTKPVRAYFLNVTRRWMDPNGDGDPSDGVDGWRLDVANEVSPVFWREWRAVVKAINPDAYIVGEIWGNAAEWLRGDQFDAVMNYRFARACVRFFIDTDTSRYSVSAFDHELKAVRADYPEKTNAVLQNLLESHDTDRLPSQIMNPNRPFDRQAGPRDNPSYDPARPTTAARQIQKLMVLFQMCYVGAPMIYYGSEAGMWGADDPDDRKPMVWPDLMYESEQTHPLPGKSRKTDSVAYDRELASWYRSCIAARKNSEALRRGVIETVQIDDDRGLYVFTRGTVNETVLVVINNGSMTLDVALPDAHAYRDLIKGAAVNGTITLQSKEGAILRKE